jgi:uracil-DNA glycosylase
MQKVNPQIEDSWKEILAHEFGKPYFTELKSFLVQEKNRHRVYPPGQLIFNAFNTTAFHDVKVIILGQDPYHGPGQAHGLCFSVPEGIEKPPSLVNIFKELNSDLGIKVPNHGNLSKWAEQGVLLLNATLTVRANQAGSHQKKGWEVFTDKVIELLAKELDSLVFILWGNYAQAKAIMIDPEKHLVLKAVHPSPLSASRGFFGSRPFSQTNSFLISKGKTPIDWDTNS